MRNVVLFFLLCLATSVTFAHPLKMNTGKLVVNTTSKECLLTLNFFIDDFEVALKQCYPNVEIHLDNIDRSMKATILSYIINNFEIKIEEDNVTWALENIKNIKENVCQVTLSGALPDYKTESVLEIKNAVLFSTFRQQTNVLHIYIDDQSQKIEEFYPVVMKRYISLFP